MREHFWSRISLTVLVFLVLFATLPPQTSTTETALCFLCGEFGLADALRNVALFIPLGAAVFVATGSLRNSVTFVVFFSAAIEVTQVFIPGRDGSAGDLVFNSAGGILGVLLARNRRLLLAPGRRLAGKLTGTAAAGLLVAMGLTGVLMEPSLPESIYFGQWTPELRQFALYRGRVLGANIDGEPIPPGRVADSSNVRELLLASAPVGVDAVAGPAPEAPAPLFSIFDAEEREIMVLGIERTDVFYRVRTRARDLRLHPAEIRFTRALNDVRPGMRISLAVRARGDRSCLALESDTARGVGDPTPYCGVNYNVGSGWQFLVPFDGLDRIPRALDALWLWALLLPIGYWASGPRSVSIAGLCVLAGLIGIPAVTPLVATPWHAVVGVLAGAATGALLRRALGGLLERPAHADDGVA